MLPSAVQIKAASERPLVDAHLFLPLPGAAGSVSFSQSITIDTEVPFVRSVEVVSGDGVYGTGDVVVLVCSFTQPVVVVGEDRGTPSIGLSLGRSDRDARAAYLSGNGTNNFQFSYKVRLSSCSMYQKVAVLSGNYLFLEISSLEMSR